MHMRTLFWLLVAVLFTGAFYFFITVRDRTGEIVPPEGALLLDLDPETADLLSVETPAWRVECRKIRGRWRMLEPMKGAADAAMIGHILGEIALLPREEVATPAQMNLRGLTLASYGLEKPAVSVTVRTGASSPVTLQVGSLAPFPSSVFVKRSDEPVVITTRTNLLAALPPSAADFRERRLLEGDPASVVRIELERRASPFVQLAREGGEWRLIQPLADRADADRVEALLADLLKVEVREVVTDEHADPAAYGLGPDSVEAVLGLWLAGEPEPVRVQVGRPSADRLCVRLGGAGPVLAVDTNMLGRLSFRVQDFRDRARLRVPPASIGGWTLEAGERRMSAVRDENGGWRLAEPLQARGDAERIQAFLAGLAGLTATEFGDTAATGAVPLVAINLWTNGAGGEQLSVGRLRLLGEEGTTFLADSGTGGVFRLESAQVKQVFGTAPFWDPLRFRDRDLLNLSTGAIRRITLVRGEVEQTAERDDKGRWIAHDGRQVNGEALDALLQAAATLRALRLEQPEDGGRAYGFETPSARLEYGLDGGDGVQKTVIFGGADAEGNRYARIQGQDLVFVLPPEVGLLTGRDLLQ